MGDETCWRTARADRLAFIVDAAEQFRALKAAILQARRSVFLVGWSFDTRIRFEPQGPTLPGPNTFGELLNWAVRQNPHLVIRVLQWDRNSLRALARGEAPLFFNNLFNADRVRLKLDQVHPLGSAHHQKLFIIDHRVAFCGGIDASLRRWDTREHLDEDPRRVDPGGELYGPWHDTACCVDGEAAATLGQLALERWRWATGENLEVEVSDSDPWPEFLEPDVREATVGVARTLPAHNGRDQVAEIERFYHAAIASAERTLYVENQYFASRRIAEAIAARLQERDGPEVVVLNPETADGWLEPKVMDTARSRLLRLVRNHDRFGRFRAFRPVTAGGRPIYVHSKAMIVDDRVLKIGSSNLNNRSLGLDSECDLILEAPAAGAKAQEIRRAIRRLRDGLVAEHLGRSREEVVAAIEAAGGSLIQAIDRLQPPQPRLLPVEAQPIPLHELPLVENEFLDPEPPNPDWFDLKPA